MDHAEYLEWWTWYRKTHFMSDAERMTFGMISAQIAAINGQAMAPTDFYPEPFIDKKVIEWMRVKAMFATSINGTWGKLTDVERIEIFGSESLGGHIRAEVEHDGSGVGDRGDGGEDPGVSQQDQGSV